MQDLVSNGMSTPEGASADDAATKILIIENDEVASRFAQMALQGACYDVVVAADGQAGMDIVTEDEGIALVVLDIEFPDITGYEVAARIRTDSDPAEIPIMILTSNASQQENFTGLVLTEANKFLTKPVEPTRLVRMVEHLLSQRPEE